MDKITQAEIYAIAKKYGINPIHLADDQMLSLVKILDYVAKEQEKNVTLQYQENHKIIKQFNELALKFNEKLTHIKTETYEFHNADAAKKFAFALGFSRWIGFSIFVVVCTICWYSVSPNPTEQEVGEILLNKINKTNLGLDSSGHVDRFFVPQEKYVVFKKGILISK
ncbi:MAG: hypothetical protein K2Q03_04250 [Sphingobacteriaceae bacterium]|nr:hypothetical protein [Sphingobacteriaceae bacterium]